MPKYEITFSGRTRGAIGVFYTIVACREADTPGEAVRMLHEPAPHDGQAFEHIQRWGVREVDELREWIGSQGRGRY